MRALLKGMRTPGIRWAGARPLDLKGFLSVWANTMYDSAKGSTRWNILNDYIGCLFIDAHTECKEAWSRVSRLPAGDERRQAFFRHPLTEETLLDLATNAYPNPALRARLTADWAKEARKRYAKASIL